MILVLFVRPKNIFQVLLLSFNFNIWNNKVCLEIAICIWLCWHIIIYDYYDGVTCSWKLGHVTYIIGSVKLSSNVLEFPRYVILSPFTSWSHDLGWWLSEMQRRFGKRREMIQGLRKHEESIIVTGVSCCYVARQSWQQRRILVMLLSS